MSASSRMAAHVIKLSAELGHANARMAALESTLQIAVHMADYLDGANMASGLVDDFRNKADALSVRRPTELDNTFMHGL